MADQFKAEFFETSAKTGENVEKMFLSLTKTILSDLKNKKNDDSENKLTFDGQKKQKIKCCN